MKFAATLTGIAFGFACLAAYGQPTTPPATNHLYVIALNGQPVKIDGELNDWTDAEFIYLSQDGPNHWYIDQGGDKLDSPADLSANVAIKMDGDNIYFAAHVRDEGGILIWPRLPHESPNLLFDFDHFGAYLGLYDIGTLPGSPHTNAVNIIDPVTKKQLTGGRTYRVKPGADDDPANATRGPDYQIGVHIQTYDSTLTNGAYFASGKNVINYNYGYVDTLVANTTVAIRPWDDEKGYTLEWKVPFAALAGRIARRTTPVGILEWPLFIPKNGYVIPFDIDVTDDDRVGAPKPDFGNSFLRFGTKPSLWRDSFAFSGRAIIKDVSGGKTAANWYHAQWKPAAEVKIDGDLDEWKDTQFIGISQDTPSHRFYAGGQPTISPADFSGYVAIRLDSANLYLAGYVRDEGGVLIHPQRTDFNTFNAMWQQDHFAAYFGLYDIGDLPASPHLKVVNIIDPATGAVLQGGRTYRVRTGADDDPDKATLGADYQIGAHIQPYTTTLANGAYHAQGPQVVNYNWGYVDTTLASTELAIKPWPDEKGYALEWKIPLASLAGKIARASKPQSVLEWPLYRPKDGEVIPFDIDLTDEDRPGETNSNFLRYGVNGSLWRDSFAFGMRMKVVATENSITTAVKEKRVTPAPADFRLEQNYPNPFNPATTIAFSLPAGAPVSLKIYNVMGQEMATLVERQLPAGNYQITWQARNLPSGVYFYRLQAGGQVEVRKMLLAK